MSQNKAKDGVDIDDLAYYFDAVAKDRYDQGQLGRRNGQVLALREKLLSLPEFEFDAAIKTIEKIVADVPSRSSTIETRQRYELQKQAKMLYERVDAQPTGSGTSGGAIDKVGRTSG